MPGAQQQPQHIVSSSTTAITSRSAHERQQHQAPPPCEPTATTSEGDNHQARTSPAPAVTFPRADNQRQQAAAILAETNATINAAEQPQSMAAPPRRRFPATPRTFVPSARDQVTHIRALTTAADHRSATPAGMNAEHLLQHLLPTAARSTQVRDPQARTNSRPRQSLCGVLNSQFLGTTRPQEPSTSLADASGLPPVVAAIIQSSHYPLLRQMVAAAASAVSAPQQSAAATDSLSHSNRRSGSASENMQTQGTATAAAGLSSSLSPAQSTADPGDHVQSSNLRPPLFLPTLPELKAMLVAAPRWTPLNLCGIRMTPPPTNVAYPTQEAAVHGVRVHAWSQGYDMIKNRSTSTRCYLYCRPPPDRTCRFSVQLIRDADGRWSATAATGSHAHAPRDVSAERMYKLAPGEMAMFKMLYETYNDQLTSRWAWLYLNIERRKESPVPPPLLGLKKLSLTLWNWRCKEAVRPSRTSPQCGLCRNIDHDFVRCQYRPLYADMLEALEIPDERGRAGNFPPPIQEFHAAPQRRHSSSSSSWAPPSPELGRARDEAEVRTQHRRTRRRIAGESSQAVPSEEPSWHNPIASRTRAGAKENAGTLPRFRPHYREELQIGEDDQESQSELTSLSDCQDEPMLLEASTPACGRQRGAERVNESLSGVADDVKALYGQCVSRRVPAPADGYSAWHVIVQCSTRAGTLEAAPPAFWNYMRHRAKRDFDWMDESIIVHLKALILPSYDEGRDGRWLCKEHLVFLAQWLQCPVVVIHAVDIELCLTYLPHTVTTQDDEWGEPVFLLQNGNGHWDGFILKEGAPLPRVFVSDWHHKVRKATIDTRHHRRLHERYQFLEQQPAGPACGCPCGCVCEPYSCRKAWDESLLRYCSHEGEAAAVPSYEHDPFSGLF